MTNHIITIYNILNDSNELNIELTEVDLERLIYNVKPSMRICFGPVISFIKIRRQLIERFTLNRI